MNLFLRSSEAVPTWQIWAACNVAVDYRRQEIRAENRVTFAYFVGEQGKVREVLQFLATAINVLKRGRIIFQPRWKAGRWRAKT